MIDAPLRRQCGGHHVAVLDAVDSFAPMKIAVDAVGIRGHGGAAVLSELVHWLPEIRPLWRWHVFLLDRSLREFDDPAAAPTVTLETTRHGDSGLQRLRWLRRYLPEQVKRIGADVLFSMANIAPSKPVCPQVVLCHRPLGRQSNRASGHRTKGVGLIQEARMWFLTRQILEGARCCEAVIVQTDTMREWISGVEPALLGRIHVIPSGYRTSSATPIVRDEKKGMIDGATHPRLIYVSHPGVHKNHHSLLRAMPRLLGAFPSSRLLLTVENREGASARYRQIVQRMREEVHRLSIGDAVTWLGILTADEVEYALRASDVSIFPSLAESFGLGLVESMAAGCPVVAADLPYAHDVCGDAATYFNPSCPSSIAVQIVRVLSDHAYTSEVQRLARERKAMFSYPNISRRVAQVLGEAAASTRGMPHDGRPWE